MRRQPLRVMLEHQVVNDLLRAGLSSPSRSSSPGFLGKAHPCGFKPGMDLDKLNQLADGLEAEGYGSKLAR